MSAEARVRAACHQCILESSGVSARKRLSKIRSVPFAAEVRSAEQGGGPTESVRQAGQQRRQQD